MPVSCGMLMLRSYSPDGTLLSEKSSGSTTFGPQCYDSRGARTEGVTEARPHVDGNTHVCGYGENGKTIYEWEDGTFTRNGKIVDDPRKDTNMSTEKITLALPEHKPEYKRVDVNGVEFEYTGTSFNGARFKRVGSASSTRYTWVELFTMGEGNKVTILPDTPVATVVRDALVKAGVSGASLAAEVVVKALDESPKVTVTVPEAAKPLATRLLGQRFTAGQIRDSYTIKDADLPRIVQVIDTDGDVWSRSTNGKYTMTRELNPAYGERTFRELDTYAPITVITVGAED